MQKSSIIDVMNGIDNLTPDTPVLDADYLDKDKALQLLSLNTHLNFDERCKDISTFVLCSFDGNTYYIDENASLWDINEDGKLSVLSVGVVGYSVDGFATDIAEKAVKEGDDATLTEMENYLEEEFIEALREQMGDAA